MQSQFMENLEITSKSMSLSEGIISRGLREMICDTSFLRRELWRMMVLKPKNAVKAWQELHNQLPDYFTYIVNNLPDKAPSQKISAVRSKLKRSNLKKRDLEQFGQYVFFEQVSHKVLRVWVMKPNIYPNGTLYPAIRPLCNISHHSLARIFYRSPATCFRDVVCEVLDYIAIRAMMVVDSVRLDLKSDCFSQDILLKHDLDDIDLDEVCGCLPTRNGVFLIRQPEDDDNDNFQPDSISEIYAQARGNIKLMTACTWIPYEPLRYNQEYFLDKMFELWDQRCEMLMDNLF